MTFIKPVVTLDSEGLARAMLDLWGRIPTSPVQPDGIVGIATGGLVCAKVLEDRLQLPLFKCALRRPSTAVKSSTPLTRRILARLPYAITNVLRRFEDWSLERKAAKGTASAPSAKDNSILDADIAVIVAQAKAASLRHLVVIDDAVDSGVTLGTVVALLRAALPATIQVTSAVVTQTRPHPEFTPDVALYHNTLCRFPWSFDFRGSRGMKLD